MCQTCVTTKKCVHCERDMKPYQVSLHTGLVSTLFKIRMAVQAVGNNLHVREQMYDVTGDCPYRLTYDELNNLSFLRVYGLVVHGDDEHPRSGRWILTSRGSAFLQNQIDVPKTRYAFDGHVIPDMDSLERVSILDFRGKLPEFSRVFLSIPPRTSAPETARLFI